MLQHLCDITSFALYFCAYRKPFTLAFLETLGLQYAHCDCGTSQITKMKGLKQKKAHLIEIQVNGGTVAAFQEEEMVVGFW